MIQWDILGPTLQDSIRIEVPRISGLQATETEAVGMIRRLVGLESLAVADECSHYDFGDVVLGHGRLRWMSVGVYAGLHRFHGSMVVQKRLAQHEALAEQRSKRSPLREHIGGPYSR